MESKTKKYVAGSSVGVIVLFLLSIFVVTITSDTISVEMPSEICSENVKLIVTKDHFRLKCGWKVLFKADTVIDYYKTYGTDEWVRDYRYKGRDGASIILELLDKGNSFDVVRTTRYRKGKQYVEDGTLKEIYTFTKDKVKITYNFDSKNSAKHRISMRIEKNRGATIDAFDPFGHTGVLTSDTLYYEGYGNLFIDPAIDLSSPTTGNTSFTEGDSASFACNASENSTSVTLFWNATDGAGLVNTSRETLARADEHNVTFSKTIPHLNINDTNGSFFWRCQACNITTCTNSSDFTLEPIYAPNGADLLKPDTAELNLVSGSNFGFSSETVTLFSLYPDYVNYSNNETILVNWSWPGHPDGDEINITLYYFTSASSTPVEIWSSQGVNQSNSTDWNTSSLGVGQYYLNLSACSMQNQALCTDDITTNYVDIFDWDLSLPGSISSVRFSPVSNGSKLEPYGQTTSIGIFKIDWLDYTPTGIINATLNVTGVDNCTAIWISTNSSWEKTDPQLTNGTRTTVLENGSTSADPDYLWAFIDKSSCTEGTQTIQWYFNLLE